MNRYMHEEYYNNPELFRRLAHRERAKAIGELIATLFSSVGRLFNYVKSRLTPRPSRWVERLG